MSENSVSESITNETWRDAYREHLIQGGLGLDAAEAIAANPTLTRAAWDRIQGNSSGSVWAAKLTLEKPEAPKKPRKPRLSLEKSEEPKQPKLSLEKKEEPRKKVTLEKIPVAPPKPRQKEDGRARPAG